MTFFFVILSSSSFFFFLFFLFLSAFFRFFLRHAQSPSRLLNKEARARVELGLSNRRRGIAAAGMLNGVGPRGEVLVENVAVEPDAALPGDGRGVRVDA